MGKTVLEDQSPCCGGDSTKAKSGIKCAEKERQKRARLVDPSKAAKVYDPVQTSLRTINSQCSEVEAKMPEALQILAAHPTDKVFDKLKEGLDARHKVYKLLTQPCISTGDSGEQRSLEQDS